MREPKVDVARKTREKLMTENTYNVIKPDKRRTNQGLDQGRPA